ncbi:MAG: hypothetical protein ACE5F4_00230 [Candidatus Paceibacteria bacterium]
MEEFPTPLVAGGTVISFIAWLCYLAKNGDKKAGKKLEECERFWRRSLR